MNLRTQITKISESSLRNITKKSMDFLIGEEFSLQLTSENSIITIQDEKLNYALFLKNNIVFVDEKTKYPKTVTKNFEKIIPIQNTNTLELLNLNGYNCILPTKNKNILETIGNGDQIIYGYTEHRILKEILDFKQCKLIIMNKNEKDLKCEFNINNILPDIQIETMKYWLQNNDRYLIPELANFSLKLRLDEIFKEKSRKERINFGKIDITIIPNESWKQYIEIEEYLLKEFPELIIFSENAKENLYLQLIKKDFKYPQYLNFLENKKGINHDT